MLDIKLIRSRPEYIDAAMVRRGKAPVSSEILELDHQVRTLIAKIQTVQEQKKEHAKMMARERPEDEDFEQKKINQGYELKKRLSIVEGELSELKAKFEEKLLNLPNIPADDCVDGKTEEDNVELRRVGTPREFDFTPREHHVLGEELGYLDIEKGVKLAGARFSVLIGPLARLERAIAQFMLDTHAEDFGYQEISVPVLVNENIMVGTGQLPKFAEDSFATTDGHWLIPTAEVALTNLVREEILREKDLPIRIMAHTPCFRSEAGAAGRDMKGIFRQRQFSKVELVSITTPDQELSEHDRMTHAAENILQKLGLPYRVVELCVGDMGFSARKTYDLEVWLPGQQKFREISSCSRCGDFQARRMGAKYRPAQKDSKPCFVCTLNGSGLAVGRTVIAVLENYQQKDGSILIPKPLLKYMNGIERITKIESDLINPLLKA